MTQNKFAAGDRFPAISLKTINDFRNANTQKMADMIATSQDVFYKQNTLLSQVESDEKNFIIKVQLPPHDARNLQVSGLKNQVKLSLARRFESSSAVTPTKENLTKKYETITDIHTLANQINFKKVEKEYSNGVLTIKLPKLA